MNIEEQKRIWNDENMWIKDGHEWSAFFGTTEYLWNLIYPKVKDYLKGDVLEIAPGFGRMTEFLLNYSGTLSIIDLNDICIKKCIDKFGSQIRNYIVNDGKSLFFPDNNFDFIFSYDSFVHMTEDVVESYIKETSRTLKNNRYAFIHHSNFYNSFTPSENIAGRASMNPDLFKSFVNKYNMEIISQEAFQVSEEIFDTLSIFYKK